MSATDLLVWAVIVIYYVGAFLVPIVAWGTVIILAIYATVGLGRWVRKLVLDAVREASKQ